MKRKILKFTTPIAGILLFLLLLALFHPRWAIRVLASQSPEVIYFVETEKPMVALTIDDGPDAQTTPQILNLLRQYDAQATFFVIAGHIPGNETLMQRTLAEGHEIGNHLLVDEPSIELSLSEFEQQLVEADTILGRYANTHWFRPGSGWFNADMLAVTRKHNYQTVLGSIYPFDPHIPSSWFATHHILAKIKPGAIIILHDNGVRGQRTVATLAKILPELQQQGYQVVTLSELLKSNKP